MCGIFLYLSTKYKLQPLDFYQQYFNYIQYRGPDNSSLKHVHSQVIMGFHRLSIMDPRSVGNQPFYMKNDKYIRYLICNGEIYNFKTLATLYNLQLSSDSDCEIILPLFDLMGMDLVNHLLGVFAFIIYEFDKKNHTYNIYAARDRIGVRPLFYSKKYFNSQCYSLGLCSEIKSLTNLYDNVSIFKPGSYIKWNSKYKYIHNYVYYNLTIPRPILYDNFDFILYNIKHLLIQAVDDRLIADRPLCCLLSGGVDSSLITSITADLLVKKNKSKKDIELATFCIGMKNGTDFKNAQLVADFLNNKYKNKIKILHTAICLDPSDFINAIPKVIYHIESYDITSVRASVGQYLISKWISENTEYKVLLLGDGADEIAVGYLGYGLAPDNLSLQTANQQLIREIHYYDVLRADRGISSNGLEARVPFLDHRLVDFYLSIHPKYKIHTKHQIEKHLLRKAFDGFHYLPNEILWRRKEAFSDAVSPVECSWYQIIQNYVDEKISDKIFQCESKKILHLKPCTKEAYYYRTIFKQAFNASDYEQYSNVIPKFWLPLFGSKQKEFVDPSARLLDCYHNQ